MSTSKSSLLTNWMWNISETTTGCYFDQSRAYYGMVFWTAGQRIDPTSNSTFIWRMTSTDTYSDRVSVMTYTNWEPGQPSYWQRNEPCMHFSSKRSYQWNDCPCSHLLCSVCELDIWAHNVHCVSKNWTAINMT